jgi:2-amino-4-hydroxy-6-hydroxymethyldihydropteridine diphosphokinase
MTSPEVPVTENARAWRAENIVDTLTGELRPFRRAVIGLGSNSGDRLDNLQGAVDALLNSPEIHAVAVSPVYETEPVGGPAGQERYLNAVLVVDTTLSARSLIERAQAVEEAFGRERHERWGPRTLDVDLLVLGDTVVDEGDVVVPHPRAHERAFVLAPWHDVDPEATIPGRGRVADLLEGTDRSGVTRVDGVTLQLS